MTMQCLEGLSALFALSDFSVKSIPSLTVLEPRRKIIQEVKSMAGKIKQMIDTIISQRAKDNAMLAGVIKTKLMLKGIDPSKFTPQSPDDPAIISKLEAVIKEL
jgi:hypothetical protein